jgi:hypothetical protein
MQPIAPTDTASHLGLGCSRVAAGPLEDDGPREDDPTGTRVDHVPPLLEFDLDDDEPPQERDLGVRSHDITLST